MIFGTPYWLRMLGGSGLIWEIPGAGKSLYLTFDDGPGPETTPHILEMLRHYGVKATFFCVGENVVKYPGLYAGILAAGHATGNHGYNHLKGWKTATRRYVENAEQCSKVVESNLFRPPYGKMTGAQRRALKNKYDIIMWTVLSRDYDAKVNRERCLERSWKYTRPGAIIVFHDHLKSMDKVNYVIPGYLERALAEGYNFKLIGVL